jgi:hypothetical protein
MSSTVPIITDRLSEEQSYLVLFMSADISGSTAYKRTHPTWLETFEPFFAHASKEMATMWKAACEAAYAYRLSGLPPVDKMLAKCPTIWKTIGDEIIFHITVQDNCEIWISLNAFSRYVKAAANNLELASRLNSKGLPELSVKGAAWLGSFPIFNLPITVSKLLAREGSGEALIEYIGPSIDAGFRISKYANRNELVISIELAAALVRLLTTPLSLPSQGLKIKYDKGEALRGLLPGSYTYPKIYLDLQEAALETAHDKLLHRHEIVDLNLLREACEDLVSAFDGRFFDIGKFFPARTRRASRRRGSRSANESPESGPSPSRRRGESIGEAPMS